MLVVSLFSLCVLLGLTSCKSRTFGHHSVAANSDSHSEGQLSFRQILEKPFDMSALTDFQFEAGERGFKSFVSQLLKSQFDSVLLYSSRSTQPADWLNPRVILYRVPLRLIEKFTEERRQEYLKEQRSSPIFAFSAHPGAKLQIELLNFNEKKRSFEFGRLDFSRPQNADQHVHGTRKVTLDRKPAGCTDCHGKKSPRPNWDPYGNWPGVYGSDERTFSTRTRYKALTQFELAKFAEFLEVARDHPIYQLVPNLSVEVLKKQGLPDYPANKFSKVVVDWNLRRLVEFIPDLHSAQWLLCAMEQLTTDGEIAYKASSAYRNYGRRIRRDRYDLVKRYGESLLAPARRRNILFFPFVTPKALNRFGYVNLQSYSGKKLSILMRILFEQKNLDYGALQPLHSGGF